MALAPVFSNTGEKQTMIDQSSILSQAAKKQVTDILGGKRAYAELWFGTATARDAAYSLLKDKDGIFYNIESVSVKKGEEKQYYVLKIKRLSETVAKKVAKPELESAEAPVAAPRKTIKAMAPLPIPLEPLRQVDNESKEYKRLEANFGPVVAVSLSHWGNFFKVDSQLLAALVVSEQSGTADKGRLKNVGEKLADNPNAFSKKTGPFAVESKGIAQLTEACYADVTAYLKRNKPALPTPSFDEVVRDYDLSIMYAAAYLSILKKSYGLTTEDELAAAYNAGPGAVQKAMKKKENWRLALSSTTRDYLTKLDETYDQLVKTKIPPKTKEA